MRLRERNEDNMYMVAKVHCITESAVSEYMEAGLDDFTKKKIRLILGCYI